MRLSISVARPNLVSVGTCFGKFSKSGKFKLHITALDHISQYAKYKVWIKPNGEMPFLYGNHVLKAHLGRITEDTPEHQGVVVFSMNDVPLGFGVTARSTVDTRKLDPTAIIVFHQAYVTAGASVSLPHVRWQAIRDQDITTDTVRDVLSAVDDDLWVAAACVDRLVDNVDVQRSLLELGINRTSSAVNSAKEALLIPAPDADSSQVHTELLSAYFTDAPEDAQLCQLRALLLHRLDRLSSFVQICKDLPLKERGPPDVDEEWEDDPWAEDGEEYPPTVRGTAPTGPPIPLTEFLVEDMLEMTCFFASQQHFAAVRTLVNYHSPILWPSRFAILDSIPSHASPSDYRDLLPAYDVNQDAEQRPSSQSWRVEQDWVESSEVKAALEGSQAVSAMGLDIYPQYEFELVAWYKRRVDAITSSTGMLDIALATVQHGASQGVPDLDELGEDLSLLARLVYDSPQPHEPQESQGWTLARWHAMTPAQVVNAYLANSTPETIATDISRLVLPYLFVLEARAERAGQPDTSLPTRLLYDYILAAPLPIIAAIFEASKPTLPIAQRIVHNDEDIARLALACLYGSDSRTEWSTMSRIFECLPAWDITPGTEDEADEADATIVSLGAFVTPSTTRPHCSAADLLLFFKPLPLVSLSRSLDILDVHLESGEILSRWNVPAPLRWFLQSAHDAAEQRAWANRMARRAGNSPNELNGRDDWEWLLEDMLKLCGPNETGLKSAFGLLSTKEILSIFFAGLLSSGSFHIAQDLLYQSHGKLVLPTATVEDICLSVSREFYDNASSGNYKVGEMKLAYDCLAVPPPSERLIKERDFIEATSRLSSFNIVSRPGIPLSPIEIRLTKDRLLLISRVLSNTAHAYKHTEVILDLLYKLGFKDDVVAEVKTLAMLSDTALQAEDFARAYEASERMIETVLKVQGEAPGGSEDATVREASEVCWVACFQLGRQPEFQDVEKKLTLLGRALELCPADKLNDVLTSWRRLEKEDLERRREHLANRPTAHQKNATMPSQKHVLSLQDRLRDLRMPTTPLINAEDAAALAGRAFNRVASNFPFAVGGRGRSGSSGEVTRSRSRDGTTRRFDGEEVSAQASRVLQKGIGWLLGADDDN
ncbi:secretory pathway protein Sec39-domain-containing protein [Melanogaster broomeanus]|nr:secretory pathway protein Sec39-domain-containing protein [Melanogaster broomeanus]